VSPRRGDPSGAGDGAQRAVCEDQRNLRPYGTDYDAALAAYEQAEQDARTRSDVEVVLLSADSLATIKRTHSSYFQTHESFEALLPAGVLHA
jgi:hypothetical protein